MINVLIVDDHQIILDGLKGLLVDEEGIENIYEAHNGAETFKVIEEQAVDLILLDINLPDKSGFEICSELKEREECPKIISLTMYGNAGYVNKMIKAKVDGYLLKNTGKEELLRAIDQVMNGKRYFSQEVMEALIAGEQQVKKPKTTDFIQKLTKREKEILQLIIDEYTTDEIASKLFISSTTVISHRKNLLRKLNSKNVAGLVKKAFEFGLLDEDKGEEV